MRKQIILAIAAIAVLALVAAPAFACPSCFAKGDKAACSAKLGKLSSADKAACSARLTKLASADTRAACSAADKAACLAKYGMSEEECRAICKEIGDNCVLTNISIKGMTCGGCEKSVTRALLETPGVVKVVKVSFKDGLALVAVDPTKSESNGLIQAVSSQGFDAQIIPAVARTSDRSSAKFSGSNYSCSAHANFSGSKYSCPLKAKASGTTSGKVCGARGAKASAKATTGTKATQVSASTGTK